MTTYRAGGNCCYNKHTMLTLEDSSDDLPGDDEQSVDGRIALTC